VSAEHAVPDLPVSQWWLSFCDTDRPAGTQFLGVCIINATDLASAITLSHVMGINPGGQVRTVGPLPAGSIGPGWCGRLLTRDEAEAVPAPDWAAEP